MAGSEVAELSSLANRLRQHAVHATDENLRDTLARLHDTAVRYGAAWSGSSLGYHATVYYQDFTEPPPGAHFSAVWGFKAAALHEETQGQWIEYGFDHVLQRIYADAGDPDLSGFEAQAREARVAIGSAKAAALSILSVYLDQRDDVYLAGLRDDIQAAEPLDVAQAVAAQLPTGVGISRDTRAVAGGITHAPHQQVSGVVASILSAFDTCSRLATLLDRAADHIQRAAAGGYSTRSRHGGSVFIGHGRSPLWRELKDFVQDRLGLPWDEFNRVPVAGTANTERLIQMGSSLFQVGN